MTTRLLPIHDPQADAMALEETVSILKKGGLVGIPTETVYALRQMR